MIWKDCLRCYLIFFLVLELFEILFGSLIGAGKDRSEIRVEALHAIFRIIKGINPVSQLLLHFRKRGSGSPFSHVEINTQVMLEGNG